MSLIGALRAAIEVGIAEYCRQKAHLTELSEADDSAEEEEDWEPEPCPAIHIQEIVERTLERSFDRLSALEVVLVGVLGAALVIGSLAADPRLQRPWLAIGLLAGAFFAALLGLLFGNGLGRGLRYTPYPRRAMVGLVALGEEALERLTIEIVSVWELNQWLVRYKTRALALGLVLLACGAGATMWEKMSVPPNRGTANDAPSITKKGSDFHRSAPAATDRRPHSGVESPRSSGGESQGYKAS